MQDMKKWFGRWDATHLLHDASLDSSINEAFLQCRCIMTWDKCGGSRFTHYTTHVARNYQNHILAERGNHTHRYMLEPTQLSAIRIEPLIPCDLAHITNPPLSAPQMKNLFGHLTFVVHSLAR